MNDLVSIVVPIYNVEKYLDRCLSSIINQTYKNLEIILINDGSTDNSLNICKKYQNDNRIKIFSRENRGLLYTRIDGVKKSSGKYLMFVDSDDYIDLDMIEYMTKMINKNNLQMLKCGYKYSYDNSVIFPVTSDEIEIVDDTSLAYKYLITRDNIHSIWAELIDNDILKKHVDEIDYTIAMGEDIHFNQIMYKYYDKIGYINKNFYSYEYDINSMSHGFEINKVKKKISDLIKVYTYFINAMENENKKYISNEALITISNNIMSLSNSKKMKFKDILNLSKEIKKDEINNKIKENITLKNINGRNKKESIMGKIFYLNMLRMYSLIIFLINRIKNGRMK